MHSVTPHDQCRPVRARDGLETAFTGSSRSITNTVFLESGDMSDRGAHHAIAPSTETPALSARQRLVLDCLAEQGGQLGLVELARLCSARTRGSPTAAVPARTLRRSYCRLAESTISELETKGLVEYREDGLVRLRASEPLRSGRD